MPPGSRSRRGGIIPKPCLILGGPWYHLLSQGRHGESEKSFLFEGMTFVAGTNLAWRSRGEWKEGALYESCVQKAQCCLCVIGKRFQRLLPCSSQQGVSCPFWQVSTRLMVSWGTPHQSAEAG